ncbi:phospholipase D family protein [Pseudomonas matsuisoli]|uniref:Phospholipase D family protein n=1 Tax=Pseudomonas matsuisoli TaxID=1515666 RepID=A0A917PWG7_9PSED|nr:phospholipase D family protein [Pseudomonas matsuisoli]GGJ96744.1 phospholipase D family protein [Pseudomonas matsuisoli]
MPVLLLLLLVLLNGCSSALPVQPSYTLPADGTVLSSHIARQAELHAKGLSGVRLLPNSTDAFTARAELARQAQSSLDLQYYIVQDGLSTRTLLKEVLAAADRGVRVRILLDDTTADGQDTLIATLAAHPNISVRLFNPLHLGRMNGVTRSLGRFLNLSQQHRRMHNKLWMADGKVGIVGGRNIGDEYFDAEPQLNFTDLDLLTVGPVAKDLAGSFDEYWNSALSLPIKTFVWTLPSRRDLAQRRRALDRSLVDAQAADPELYQRLTHYQRTPQLLNWLDDLIWVPAIAMWDAPAKVLASDMPGPELLLATRLSQEIEAVQHELMLVSAYFVPTQRGADYLAERAESGVSIQLLTNSLEATDVPAVHGGYAPYRHELLASGVKLYELRRQPEQKVAFSLTGDSESSLHTKAAIMDRQKVFIGSFNFDPRSMLWNTEVGVLVDSKVLAERVRQLTLEGMSPALSYDVRLERDETGEERLVWWTERDGKRYRLYHEPGGVWRRFNAWIARTVGLERML